MVNESVIVHSAVFSNQSKKSNSLSSSSTPTKTSTTSDSKSTHDLEVTCEWAALKVIDSTHECLPSFASHAILLNERIVLVLSGVRRSLLNTISKLDLRTKQWTNATLTKNGKPFSGLACYGAISLKERVFIFGGISSDRLSDSLYELDLCKMSLIEIEVCSNRIRPCARIGHSFVASVDTDQVYLFAGVTKSNLLTTGFSNWMPGNVLSQSIATANINLYLNDMWQLSMITSRSQKPCWLRFPKTSSTPRPREGHSCCIFVDKKTRTDILIFFGGNDGICGFNDMYLFNVTMNRWVKIEMSKMQILPEPRSYHSGIKLRGYMLAIFGGWVRRSLLDPGYCSNQIFLFSLGSMHVVDITIKPQSLLPEPRAFHCAKQQQKR